MKITYQTLTDSVSTLSKLNNLELPIKDSYIIAKNIKNIQNELNLYNQQKDKLLKRYGELDEEGNVKSDENGLVKIVDAEKWTSEFNELQSIEVEIDITPISIDVLMNNDVKMSPSELLHIDYLIK